ncbi:uncharacterized protein Z519_03504 [Cladophialophora bantiana CBS 173.52]|uniref:Uncharacterized protein n=1 Tax=Cladophialophora bantiana (strain ATCC 10958 / CBS 173.52 / CDC B-1940 / NIH 8579) TaxID=1442370 RepID=A0A0D2HZU9_CLAB1|nr:uncharacterized protein Z519_03504 [Cladophialophora bantiana CBS 173.52]KIW96435.1 hypothetical protein Z519_03504 [Cladophialophora bantiana CBS 173.52]
MDLQDADGNNFYGRGGNFSVCSQVRAKRQCPRFFQFLREARHVKIPKLTQEGKARREIVNCGDEACNDEHEIPKQPLSEEAAIDGFVEIYF